MNSFLNAKLLLMTWLMIILSEANGRTNECPSIAPIENGKYNCSNGFNIGSECIFRCDVYYFLYGFTSISCEDSPTGKPDWNRPPPMCEDELLCQPGLVDPKNGQMNCSNGNKFNSVCDFSCDDGFFIDGSDSVRCNEIQSDNMVKWNGEEPLCKPCVDCEVDVLLVFQPGDFETIREWTIHTLKQLSGAMKRGNAKISMMEVEGRKVVGCNTKYNKETYKIVLDLDSYSIYDVERQLDDHKDRNNVCHSPKHGIRPAVKYMDLFSNHLTRIVIIFTKKEEKREQYQEELEHAKQNGVFVIFAPIRDPELLKKSLDIASMTSMGVEIFLSKNGGEDAGDFGIGVYSEDDSSALKPQGVWINIILSVIAGVMFEVSDAR